MTNEAQDVLNVLTKLAANSGEPSHSDRLLLVDMAGSEEAVGELLNQTSLHSLEELAAKVLDPENRFFLALRAYTNGQATGNMTVYQQLATALNLSSQDRNLVEKAAEEINDPRSRNTEIQTRFANSAFAELV